MRDRLSYEVVVVGGGPAGMTTALYTTRLGHRTAVFEKEGGRHAAVSHVHNLYGVSEDVSGEELSNHAVDQFETYGGDYYLDAVAAVRETGGRGNGTSTESERRFVVEGAHATVEAERVVFATGFTDREPDVPGLKRFTGRGLHYCLHCDAYALGDDRVFVLGDDDHAARVAMLMLNFTADVDLLLDGDAPDWSEGTERQLRAHPVTRVDGEVEGAFAEADARDGGRTDRGERGGDAADDEIDDHDERWLGGLTFADGESREYRGGFAMYGSEYNTDLAASLGCDLADDGALTVDGDHRTSVNGAYAVGDVTHGQNQTVVAMADGAEAGIAIHKDLRRYPRPPDDLESLDDDSPPAAAADLRARMRLVRDRRTLPGLRESESIK